MAQKWRAGFLWGLTLVLGMAFVLPCDAGAESLRLAASIPPQRYFLERIGGDRVAVEILLPPGVSPHTYEPKPSQLAHISGVRAYFSMGIPIEAMWLKRLQGVHPDLRIYSMHEGIERRPMPRSYEEVLDPGQDRASEANGHPDPHVWLTPQLARIMARNTLKALIRMDPQHAESYRANHAKLDREIRKLDRELEQLFAGIERRFFLVYHPSWGYFASTYGLFQIPIKLGGERLSAKRLTRVIDIAREKGVRTVFVQPQFSRKAAQQVARSLEGRTRVLDPLAVDWAANLRECARRIRKTLE